MADIDGLTDSELRTKLTEFGFPLMPITGTTRKLMVKKLKHIMENQGKTPSDRRSLGKFSSDEESDTEVKPKKEKNRRATMAVPPTMQEPKVAPKPAAEKKEMEPPAPVIKEKRKSSSRSGQVMVGDIIVQLVQAPDTNSDSEPEIVETEHKSEIPIKIQKNMAKKEPPATKSVVEQPKQNSVQSPPSSSRYSVYSKTSYNVSEELDKIRSRLSLNPRAEYTSRNTIAFDCKDESGESPPFLSNFTRNLSKTSQNDYRSAGRTDATKQYDTNGSSVYNRGSHLAPRPKPRDYTSTYVSSSNNPEITKTNNVSFLLIAALALFFIVLAAIYYGMHSGTNPVEAIGKASKYVPQDSV